MPLLLLALSVLFALALPDPGLAEPTPAGHGSEPLALEPHVVISEEANDQRRLVAVRLQRRINEADALQIAAAVHARARRPVPRSFITFYLPGMATSAGAWASVVYAPEPKFLAHGLKREDEEALLAEHMADRRPIIGAWLTSPPAAAGRLTIHNEPGRLVLEWRLRNGQRSTDELREVRSASGRRFEIPGGEHFVVNRSGDLEMWSGTTRIAVAERIRRQPSTATAAARGSPVPGRMALGNAPVRDEAAGGLRTTEPEAGEPAASPTSPNSNQVSDTVEAKPEAKTARPGPTRKVRARREQADTLPSVQNRPTASTNGDSISAKLSGAL